MRRVNTKILGLIAAIIPAMLWADSGLRPKLANSMSYYEVLKAWGPPLEKHEHEAKREDIWMYGDSKVIFSNGKVVAWMHLNNTQQPIREAASNDEAKTIEGFGSAIDDSSDFHADNGNEEQVEQILRDIMQDPGDAAAPVAPPS